MAVTLRNVFPWTWTVSGRKFIPAAKNSIQGKMFLSLSLSRHVSHLLVPSLSHLSGEAAHHGPEGSLH